MLKFLRTSVAAAAVAAGIGLASPAMAQTAAEISVRMSQLEDEVKQLTGQVEQLTFEVRQLKSQISGAKSGAVDSAAPPLKKQLAVGEPAAQPGAQATDVNQPASLAAQTPAATDSGSGQIQSQTLAPVTGAEQIVDNGQADAATQSDLGLPAQASKAPGPQVLGSIATNSAAKAGDGGFQGQILVAPSQEEAPAVQLQPALQDQTAEQGTLNSNDGVEQVALAPDTPEALYERSYESLMQRQFDVAQGGFRKLIDGYPQSDLVGPANYWLGEAFFAQQDYKSAAESFLLVYKKYPKTSKGPDSMVKLGMSLAKLGNQPQACAVFGSVSVDFPKAAQSIKRAQLEAKRAGCAS